MKYGAAITLLIKTLRDMDPETLYAVGEAKKRREERKRQGI